MLRSTSSNVSAGVRIGESNVEIVVKVTDSATSARARNATTFEAVPPGQVPTRMTPTASSGGNCNARLMPHARAGMTMNCAPTPAATARGRVNTAAKSAAVSVVPIPSMMTASSQPIQGSAQRNPSGARKPLTAAARMTAPNHRPAKLLSAINPVTRLVIDRKRPPGTATGFGHPCSTREVTWACASLAPRKRPTDICLPAAARRQQTAGF